MDIEQINTPEKIKLLEDSAKLGNLNAQMKLAELYEYGYRTVKPDLNKSFSLYRKAANLGEKEAYAKVGEFLLTGKAGERNYPAALENFLKAARMGDAMSQFNAGYMYEKGVGCKRSIDRAMDLYEEAAINGLPKAMIRLANHILKNLPKDERDRKPMFTRAMKLFEDAARMGNEEAQLNLALLHDDPRGMAPDKKKAIKWYTLAAEQGNSTARLNLGCIYFQGDGVSQNYSKARDLFLMAAKSGNLMAKLNLGEIHLRGLGVPKDPKNAFHWFMRAAAGGSAYAQNVVGEMYLKGEGIKRNFKEAHKWFLLSARQNNPEAQFNLGTLYETGSGVTENIGKAILWYQKAAKLDNIGAKIALYQIKNKQKRRSAIKISEHARERMRIKEDSKSKFSQNATNPQQKTMGQTPEEAKILSQKAKIEAAKAKSVVAQEQPIDPEERIVAERAKAQALREMKDIDISYDSDYKRSTADELIDKLLQNDKADEDAKGFAEEAVVAGSLDMDDEGPIIKGKHQEPSDFVAEDMKDLEAFEEMETLPELEDLDKDVISGSLGEIPEELQEESDSDDEYDRGEDDDEDSRDTDDDEDEDEYDEGVESGENLRAMLLNLRSKRKAKERLMKALRGESAGGKEKDGEDEEESSSRDDGDIELGVKAQAPRFGADASEAPTIMNSFGQCTISFLDMGGSKGKSSGKKSSGKGGFVFGIDMRDDGKSKFTR